MKWRFAAVLIPALIAGRTLVFGSESQDRTVPHPLDSHPGNIFISGERVIVSEPPGEGETWRLIDYEGKVIMEGKFADRHADLGRLPVGHYDLLHGTAGYASNRISVGVLEPLRAPTPIDSPIGIDVAMAWFFSGERMKDVANICALAGMNRVRDRLTWEEMEPKRGRLAGTNKYDVALDVQRMAGLQVLQVSHIAASWANPNVKRFPEDLRDTYNFFRDLAQRWQGRIEAIEPWNEADIEPFGGHPGSEIASFQKAAYLGLKAGNPKVTACLTPFAIRRAVTLGDFQQNEVWPFFDTYNLHHYETLDHYPALYADHRAVSAGKPLWVSECSVHVKWQGDEQLKELSGEDQRLQSERVTKTYVLGLHQGAAAIFYFMLPHYSERQLQYGVLHPDLTPRPAFLAAAAAGRLLAGAKPLGRIDIGDRQGQGYFFRAAPDGKPSDVMVIWAKEQTNFDLPAAPRACFDHLGRAHSFGEMRLAVGPAPLYVVFPKGGHPGLKPPPKPAKALAGKAVPVVIQAVLPEQDSDFKESAYKVPKAGTNTIPIWIYNFGTRMVRGGLTVTVPEGWKMDFASDVELASMDRQKLTLKLSPGSDWTEARVRITGDFGPAGKSLLSFRLLPK
jgi:hypothetical protein